MPDLSAPLRVTWELPSEEGLAAHCWREIVRARVLFVEIRLTPAGVPVLGALADLLGPSPRVALLTDGECARAALEVLPREAASALQLLLLPPYPAEGEDLGWADRFRSVEWCVWSTREGLASFGAALSRAGSGSGAVAVLNPAQPARALDGQDRAEAERTWRCHGSEAVRLRVHDLFLDEALGREPFAGYAGCQAGRTLAHLNGNGKVVACRTLPVCLGDLGRNALTDIWSGSERRSFLERFGRLPQECAECAVAGPCGGGCRGLSATGDRDPSCTRMRRP